MIWLRRHPVFALLMINIVISTVILGAAEVFLRFYATYHPGYYAQGPEKPGVYHFPYGLAVRNSIGYPDDEFDLSSPRRRVGYFGDSVTRGVGVGYGDRITDLLEKYYPGYEHWTFGSATNGVDETGAATIRELAAKFDLHTVVYLMNLNDLLPSQRFEQSESDSLVRRLKKHLQGVDWLRGHSYLYTMIRDWATGYLQARGYGHHGWRAAELFPEENAEIVRQTAERVVALAEEIERQGCRFVVVLIPYEMQISDEAARVYRDFGIHWENGFLEGSTQRALVRYFAGRVRAVDALRAFVPGANGAAASRKHRVGEYFVYNRGGKYDWNHLNAAGHRAIARFLAEQDLLQLGERGRRSPAG